MRPPAAIIWPAAGRWKSGAAGSGGKDGRSWPHGGMVGERTPVLRGCHWSRQGRRRSRGTRRVYRRVFGSMCEARPDFSGNARESASIRKKLSPRPRRFFPPRSFAAFSLINIHPDALLNVGRNKTKLNRLPSSLSLSFERTK